jgi:hypothetical protein
MGAGFMTHAQIAVSTVVGVIATAMVVLAYARWRKTPLGLADTLLLAVTVGVSILLWREAGNTPTLNDDPIPLVSPNDVLGPVLTWLCLGVVAAFRPTLRTDGWPALRATLTLLSLVVNVVTI